jgi:hypothetical protein
MASVVNVQLPAQPAQIAERADLIAVYQQREDVKILKVNANLACRVQGAVW